MPDCVAFVTEQPVVEIDGSGVNITYRSGPAVYWRRMRRADWRRHLETSIRQLNDYEAAERENVVEMRRHA